MTDNCSDDLEDDIDLNALTPDFVHSPNPYIDEDWDGVQDSEAEQ